MSKKKKRFNGKVSPRELYGGQNYKTLLSKVNETRYTIALDRLHFYCVGNKFSETTIKLGEFVLSHKGHGTSFYENSYDVLEGGIKVATFNCSPRSNKIMKAEASHLEIENSLLYTNFWLSVVEDITSSIGLQIKSYSRLDLAIDGLNYIPEFLNIYARQAPQQKIFHCLGRAKWNSLVLDHAALKYKAFKIGSNTSEKQITVYNKTKELEQSNKNYIRHYWEKNGIATDGEVWRVEMRLKGKEINLIKHLSIQQLNNSKMMEQVFYNKAKKFFEFTYNDNDTNVTRQDRVKLINFKKEVMEPLEFAEKPHTDGRYKAKLALHEHSKCLITGYAGTDEERNTMVESIEFGIRKYELKEWYEKRLPDWINLYAKDEYSPEELEQFL